MAKMTPKYVVDTVICGAIVVGSMAIAALIANQSVVGFCRLCVVMAKRCA